VLYLAPALVLPATLAWTWLRRAEAPERTDERLAPALFALPFFLLLIWLSLYNTLTADYQAQGRYLLPAAAPIVLQAFDGCERAGGRLARHGPALLMAFFVAENLASVVYVR
jgi:hypothetical protein